jgi:hypothetical protein
MATALGQADAPVKRERAPIPFATLPTLSTARRPYQTAAEELKVKTKAKPALADGLHLAQGHRLGTILTLNAS